MVHRKLGIVLIGAMILASLAGAVGAQESGIHFEPVRYEGQTLLYRLTTNGSVEATVDQRLTSSLTFSLSAMAEIRFGASMANGQLPFVATLRLLSSDGLDIPSFAGTIDLSGTLSPTGSFLQVETPPYLAELGLDSTDLLVGLIVPAPDRARNAGQGVWQSTFTRSGNGRPPADGLTVTGTYTMQGDTAWGSRTLRTVVGRFRADATVRSGTLRTQVQEIGHGILYTLPGEGVVAMSSVSLIHTIEARDAATDTRTKTTLTTTLELIEGDPQPVAPPSSTTLDTGEPGPVESTPVEPTPVEPTPIESVRDEALPAQPAPDESADREAATVDQTPDEPAPVEAEPVSPVEDELESPEAQPVLPADDADVTQAPEPIIPVDDVEADQEPPLMLPDIDVEETHVTEEPSDEPTEPQPLEPAEEEAEPPVDEPPLPPADEHVESPDDATPLSPVAEYVTYHDPAGRFRLQLESGWADTPVQLSLRGTEFAGSRPGEVAYVYVVPLPSPAATAATIAHSALTTYGETLRGFRLLDEPQPDQLDGEPAYRAHYQYLDARGRPVTEWAIFARKRDRAFYLEYAPGEGATDGGLAAFERLRDGFTFGDSPRGAVSAQQLAESLVAYEDPAGRFRLMLPSLWPLTESADGGASTTFTEIGEAGYLTVFVDGGAQGVTSEQVLAAWRDEWAKEPGFRLVAPLAPAPLGGRPGHAFAYSWQGSGERVWTRLIHGAVVDDYLFVVAIDYEEDGFSQRAPLFQEMMDSFQMIAVEKTRPEPASEESPTLPDESAPDLRDASTPPAESAPGSTEEPPAVQIIAPPFAEPESEESVILLGRVLTRYPGPDGRMVERWGANLEVAVLAEQMEYVGVTDHLGYLYVANLPRIPGSRLYTILRLDGPMLGFSEPVTVSFDNLRVGLNGPRVSHLRTLIITLHSDRSLSVEVVKQAPFGEGEPSALEHFVRSFGASQWAEHVQEVIRSGMD